MTSLRRHHAEPYDLGAILRRVARTRQQLVRYGEGFFKSIGFDALPETFWQRSMLTHPHDRDVVCHASAWDMDMELDVRLKVCLQPTTDDFVPCITSWAITITRWLIGSSPSCFATARMTAFMKRSAIRSRSQ